MLKSYDVTYAFTRNGAAMTETVRVHGRSEAEAKEAADDCCEIEHDPFSLYLKRVVEARQEADESEYRCNYLCT